MSTVLIVDDYADALQVWDLYLRAYGYDVLTAATGAGALAEATGQHPDIIVMDLELPDLSGVEVARVLQGREETRGIPKIAVTGHSQARQLEEARQSGFDMILIKPCDPDDLLSAIRHLLDGGGAGRPTAPEHRPSPSG